MTTPAYRTQATAGSPLEDPARLAMLAGGLGLAVLGLVSHRKRGLAVALAGGALIYRGATGGWPFGVGGSAAAPEIEVETSMTVSGSPEELYRRWRDLERLPDFMRHLESVVVHDDRRSRWTARAPLGARVSWEAEIVDDTPGRRLAWRSLPGSDIENSGNVGFEALPGDRGTIVRVRLEYRPPAGKAGAVVARLLGEEPKVQAQDDLRRFKAIAEAGNPPTTEGQPAGGARKADLLARSRRQA